MRHISRVALTLERGVETIFFEPRAGRAVAAIRLRLDEAADSVRGIGVQRVTEMAVKRCYGTHRVANQIKVLDVKDRFREVVLSCRGNH